MAKEKRFIKVYSQGAGSTEILVDKKTGVNYLFSASGYAGGLKETKYRKLIAEKPEVAVRHAVVGMLPKGPLGYAMLKKLHVYAGAEHKHQAQQPELLKL